MTHSLSKHLATLVIGAALISAASTSVAFAYSEPPVVGSPFDSGSSTPPALGDGGNTSTPPALGDGGNTSEPPALGSNIDNSNTTDNSNLNDNSNNDNGSNNNTPSGCISNCGYNSYNPPQQLIELADPNGANGAPDTLDPNAATDATAPTPKKGTRLPKTGPEMLPMLITSMLATTGYRLYRKKQQT